MALLCYRFDISACATLQTRDLRQCIQVRHHIFAGAETFWIEFVMGGEVRQGVGCRQPIHYLLQNHQLDFEGKILLEVAHDADSNGASVITGDGCPAHMNITPFVKDAIFVNDIVVADIRPMVGIHMEVLDAAHGFIGIERNGAVVDGNGGIGISEGLGIDIPCEVGGFGGKPVFIGGFVVGWSRSPLIAGNYD